MKIQSRLRASLEKRGYEEAVTPILQTAPGSDPEIEPMAVHYTPVMEPDPPARNLLLHTSPEFAMKRLLCRGEKAVYQVCQVFRQGESGPLHSPEFTMAEWYRAGITYLELMEEVEQVVAETIGPRARVRAREMDISPPFPRVTVSHAFHEAGVDMEAWESLADTEWRERYYAAYVERVEPWLEKKGPVFLIDYPARVAILSRLKPENPELAERFELIVAGVEIANGCTELTDPEEHERRLALDREVRRARGGPDLPAPRAFLADLKKSGLPPCAGVALGVDRLAMIATGAERIDQVQAFPFAE
jgi:lysyl-tRNA synthetase class 2